MPPLTRRRALASLGPLVGAGAAAKLGAFGGAPAAAQNGDATGGDHASHGGDHGHLGFRSGTRVDSAANGFDPAEMVRDFDRGTTRRGVNGRTVREWTMVAVDKEIEVAPGVKTAVWAYNGRVPGPTLRAREGERLRVRFVNGSEHQHTIHFHGIHPDTMDGIPGIGAGLIDPGGETTYEFDAEPFGLHLYHCHATPLAAHIGRGLYGAFIIDPRAGRPEADELVMVMNGFDTNFDASNEIYAANTVGFAYKDDPIRVRRDALVRIYLVNALEFDPVNSLHIHANFFHYYPTGTSLEPTELTDTIMQCQGQRGIAELRFPYTGRYMFHAHQSEFAELGWMGFFEVVD